MFFRQLLHDDLGCASYLVGGGGRAAVVDPRWEIEEYLALAEANGLELACVLETHNHADHVSGHGRLAEAAGLPIRISAEANAEYEHEPLAGGDAIELGEVRIEALATPGHRPEHLSFVLVDGERGREPWAVLTGDSLFVGDLARPDLAVEPEEGARGLFASIRRLLELGDPVEIWPGHVGGSMCGGAGMSEKPSSTIGFERRHSRLVRLAAAGDQERFVRDLTGEQQEQPPNFERIVELNRGPLPTGPGRLELLSPARVRELADGGAIVLDGREPREFDAAHVPGALNVTMTKPGAGTRAAWVLDLDDELVVTAAGDAEAARLARLLEAVGFRRIQGFLAGGIGAWLGAGEEIQTTPAIDPAGLAAELRRQAVLLVDVREDDEWNEGHVEGSLHVPYHELRDGLLDELRDGGRRYAVACSGGNRSSLAASLLRRAGAGELEHVADGGVSDLADHGIVLSSGDR